MNAGRNNMAGAFFTLLIMALVAIPAAYLITGKISVGQLVDHVFPGYGQATDVAVQNIGDTPGKACDASNPLAKVFGTADGCQQLKDGGRGLVGAIEGNAVPMGIIALVVAGVAVFFFFQFGLELFGLLIKAFMILAFLGAIVWLGYLAYTTMF